MRLSADSLRSAIRMVENGSSQREVARTFNVSQSVISRAVQRYRTTGNVNYRHGGGRRRSTTQAQNRYLRIIVRQNSLQTAHQLNNALREATGVVISDLTVRRRLHEFNLRVRRRASCP